MKVAVTTAAVAAALIRRLGPGRRCPSHLLQRLWGRGSRMRHQPSTGASDGAEGGCGFE